MKKEAPTITRAHAPRKGMGFNMIEKIVNRDGKQVTEIRSDAGKLLFIKTLQGYEIKCPRTKQVYVVKYEDMLLDCMANKKQRTDDLESRSLIIKGKKGV